MLVVTFYLPQNTDRKKSFRVSVYLEDINDKVHFVYIFVSNKGIDIFCSNIFNRVLENGKCLGKDVAITSWESNRKGEAKLSMARGSFNVISKAV